jgi:hypothetical protein
LRSPGLFNWDLGMARPSRYGTRRSGAVFEQVRSARDPRIGQLALKITF